MSVITSTSLTSLRVVAASIDGTVGGRFREPLRSASSTMMGRFLEDRQRYDAIACGVPTTSKGNSPGQDIESMKEKLHAVIPKASKPIVSHKE
ncbi:uncharacterized protein PAC_13089 [Phialocephala subalpina]|uniref:Uncharacterized protein n=1 Tax=Phialocephala subalpina TaxID=576137 RepID=A0A1L7XDV4_9HELO|nr:uncharacterized protein PAC_13089 [Phialocephala subalpina]